MYSMLIHDTRANEYFHCIRCFQRVFPNSLFNFGVNVSKHKLFYFKLTFNQSKFKTKFAFNVIFMISGRFLTVSLPEGPEEESKHIWQTLRFR